MTVLKDSDILSLIQSNQERLVKLENSMQQHGHDLSFATDGGGGKKLSKEGLSQTLQDEIDANLAHRKAEGNAHNVLGSQILVGEGDLAGHKISEAIQTTRNSLADGIGKLGDDTIVGDNLTRTGDPSLEWTLDEVVTKNNRALYDLLATHNHNEVYIEPLELKAEVERHFQSGEHDHRYYRKDEIVEFLGTKSDTAHLHDDQYFTKSAAAATFVNATGDTMTGDLLVHKPSPKLILSDQNTEGEAFSLVSTNGRFEILDDSNIPWVSIDRDLNLVSGGTFKVNETPVSLEGHKHQDIYYNKTEIADLLSTKSGTEHLHDARYYTHTEINSFLDRKANIGHNHDNLYYAKEIADNRFLAQAGGTIDHLRVVNGLIAQDRIDASESGLYFPTYCAGLSIAKDHDDVWGLELRSGNLQQVFIQSDKLKLRRDLEVGGNIYLAAEINGVNIQHLKEAYDQHASKADAHHPRYSDYEAKQAINNDAEHYHAANHKHDHNTIYYQKDHLDYLFESKSDITHDHDLVYMPRTELNEILEGKASSDHDHLADTYTKTEVDAKVSLLTGTLAQKAEALHDHDIRYYNKAELDEKFSTNYGTTTKVLSGEMLVDSQGRATLPVPDGFARYQCHYMASIAEDTTVPYSTAGISINRMTGEIQVQPNSVKSINYLVIGVQ